MLIRLMVITPQYVQMSNHCVVYPNLIKCSVSIRPQFKRPKNLKSQGRDFPGGPVVKNPPTSVGDEGPVPGWGGRHVPRSSEACAPQSLSTRGSPRSATREGTAERSPCAATKRSHCPQLEKACLKRQRPGLPKIDTQWGFSQTQRQILIQTNCIKMQPQYITFLSSEWLL